MVANHKHESFLGVLQKKPFACEIGHIFLSQVWVFYKKPIACETGHDMFVKKFVLKTGKQMEGIAPER
jgi:hypothetical protein